MGKTGNDDRTGEKIPFAGPRLDTLLKHRGWKPADLARESGISQTTLTRCLRSKEVQRATYHTIIDYLKIPPACINIFDSRYPLSQEAERALVVPQEPSGLCRAVMYGKLMSDINSHVAEWASGRRMAIGRVEKVIESCAVSRWSPTTLPYLAEGATGAAAFFRHLEEPPPVDQDVATVQNAWAGEPLRVCVNYITLGCLAATLALATDRDRGINLSVDYNYQYGADQIREVDNEYGPDVLVTVDGASVLAGASYYRIILPVHTEVQDCMLVAGGRSPARPPLLHLVNSSPDEHRRVMPGFQTCAPDRMHGVEELYARVGAGLAPGTLIIGWDTQLQRIAQLHPGLQVPPPGSELRQRYTPYVSISVHRRHLHKTIAGWVAPFARIFSKRFEDLRGLGYGVMSLLDTSVLTAGYDKDVFWKNAPVAFGF